ncbi:MAG: DUF4367 domain-containing protein [bacterium]|nr:DUF4367 domain-containing protein [bacterium]
MKEIIVNGRRYDAETGQLLEVVEPKAPVFEAKNIHQSPQKSQTLNRKFVRMPEKKTSEQIAIEQFKRRHDYAEERKLASLAEVKKYHAENSRKILRRSGSAVIQPISRKVEGVTRAENSSSKDKKSEEIAPYKIHPIQAQAIAQIQAKNSDKILPSMAEIKQNAIASALNRVAKEQQIEQKTQKKSRRAWWIFGGVFAVAIIVGAGILMNLPQISAQVASAQSGFSATIPSFQPEGFRLKELPYFDGKSIVMRFSNNNKNYEIKQIQSSWDSASLLENYVLTKWGEDYTTYREKGLTVYKKDGSAVWVNGGRMFEISGAEELSNEEILRIAVSF